MIDKFHLFEADTAAVELPRRFTCPFCYEPHPLSLLAAGQVQRYVASRSDWADELGAGKMLGVLVARDGMGRLGFLAAFSGNLAGSVRHDYFVPPVYDLLDPAGEFKQGEAQITAWSMLPNWPCYAGAMPLQCKKSAMKSRILKP